MKLTVTIIASVLAAGMASAQSPSIIQNTRNTMNGVNNNATAASNQALGVRQSPATGTAATHASANSSRVTVVTPVKSPAVGVKHRVKRVPGVVVKPGAMVAVPKTNAPAGTTAIAGNAPASAAGEPGTTPDSKFNANGRRDPFISPVVSHAGGSGCSTGKKCLEIGAINLRGVVRSENGFIAVVSNDLNKAYFLRENDPVFNGYVMKITGDSIVFQETLQDRLGKSFTREVVKKITTPAV
jgi:hypothetical protein